LKVKHATLSREAAHRAHPLAVRWQDGNYASGIFRCDMHDHHSQTRRAVCKGKGIGSRDKLGSDMHSARRFLDQRVPCFCVSRSWVDFDISVTHTDTGSPIAIEYKKLSRTPNKSPDFVKRIIATDINKRIFPERPHGDFAVCPGASARLLVGELQLSQRSSFASPVSCSQVDFVSSAHSTCLISNLS
jgi:hypothetical protein